MSRKRYRGCSSVEAEVLRKEQRQEIRRLALVKGAEASVNGRARYALSPSDLAELKALDDEELGRAAEKLRKRWEAR